MTTADLLPSRDGSAPRAASGVRITDVSVTIFEWNDIPAIRYGDRNPVTAPQSELGLVTLHTDAGLEGHAFLGSSIRGARLDVVALIRNLKPVIVGRDPFDRERLWDDLHKLQRAATMRTIGAIDVALWDLAGKFAGLPISRLLGRCRESIPAYASSVTMARPEQYGEEALRIAEAGFAGYKLHPPRDLAGAIAACRAARRAVGDDYVLMVDTAGALDYPEALRLGRELEELGYLWFEDPLPEDDIFNSARLRQKLSIPIMATEYSPGGFHAFAPWITGGATDYLRGDVAVKGGLTGIMKASVLADAFRMRFEIHHGGNSLNNVAQLHAAMAMRNTTFFEVLLPDAAQKYGVVDDLVVKPDGTIDAIDDPGLGVTLDTELIARRTLEVLR
jgi:L-alanine-DL-glutamate epimerase-like enolase superfamily enzyme